MLTVCTTAIEARWGAISDLLLVLGSTASSSGHDRALIDATAWADRYLLNGAAGTLRRQVYAETLAGRGSQRLMLSRTPVLAIQRLLDSTSTAEAAEYCSTARRLEDADAGFLELTTDAGFAWDAVYETSLGTYPRPSAVARPWYVTYEAGWQFACTSSTSNDWLTTTTGRTLPDDIARAVVLKAAELYQGSGGLSIEMMKVGPLAMNFSSEQLDPVSLLLVPYRRL